MTVRKVDGGYVLAKAYPNDGKPTEDALRAELEALKSKPKNRKHKQKTEVSTTSEGGDE